jgi:hypothetical protein
VDKRDEGDCEKRRVIGCPLSVNGGMTADYGQWDYETRNDGSCHRNGAISKDEILSVSLVAMVA